MAATNITVESEGDNREWSVSSGGAAEAVQTDDGDTTYIHAPEELTHDFVLTSLSLPDGATISNVTTNYKVRRVSTNGSLRLVVNANGDFEDATAVVVSNSSYEYKSLSLDLAPGGTPWLPEMFDAGGVVVQIITESGSDTVRCTHIYAVVTYTVGGVSASKKLVAMGPA